MHIRCPACQTPIESRGHRIGADLRCPACHLSFDLISDESAGSDRPAQSAALPSQDSPVVVLEVVAGPHQGERFEFQQHQTLIAGRSREAQLRLHKDRHFSRFHFRLEVNPPTCYLTNFDSRNGTRLNGERTREAFLKDGDVIAVGKTELRVSLPGGGSQTGPYAPTVIGNLTDNNDQSPPPAQDSPNRQSLPQPIQGYELLQRVGSGAMGIVYRAARKSTRTTVALKIIVPAHAANDAAMRLFLREASILGQLKHSHIVEFFEFGIAAGQLFLAMEYVEQISLDKLLTGRPPNERVRICCAIACRVLEALSFAHERGIVHRDVKPRNVLLSRPGRKLKVKLADFGLAKSYLDAGFSDVTRDGEARGTVAYMAPEQIIDCRYAKPCCDVYSVGATLYHYLSGEFPHNFPENRSKFAVVLEDDPVPLIERCPEIPPEVAEIVDCSLAKQPEDRFASAEKMKDALLPFSRR